MHAQVEPAPKVIAESFDAKSQLLESEAKRDALKKLNDRLDDHLKGKLPIVEPDEYRRLGVRETVLRTIREAGTLDKARQKCLALFKKRLGELDEEKKAALESYRTALDAEFREHAARAEVEWQLQQSLHDADSWRRFCAPIPALVVLVAFCLGGLCWHFEQRMAIRCFLRRKGPIANAAFGAAYLAAVLGLGALGIALGLAIVQTSDESVIRNPADDLRRRTELAAEDLGKHQQANEQRDKEIGKLRKDFEGRRQAALREWNQVLLDDKEQAVDLQVLAGDADIAKDLEALLESALVVERAGRQAKELKDKVVNDHAALERFAEAAAGRRQWLPGARASVMVGVGLFWTGAIVWPRWRRWRERRRQQRQCPRCLQTNLEKVARAKTSLTSRRAYDLRCKAELSGERCLYHFPARYNQLPRIYLPTYGHYMSGKTTWLTAAYNLLSSGGSVGKMSLSPIRTKINLKMDDLVQQLMVKKISPSRTLPDSLPDPLLYHLADGDDLASAHFLLNLFDFAGEIAHFRSVVRHDGSYRALMMHGFIFFVDPTEKIDVQFNSIVAFHQALRELSEQDVRVSLDTPVAVCVTKLDLLPTTPFYQRALPWLARLRKTAGQPATMAVLQARSRLVEEIQRELFQGFDIQAELHKNFGPSFLFFPQTCFGLQEEELGLPLDKRGPLAPFGTLEPLQWLLHMNGLQVLA